MLNISFEFDKPLVSQRKNPWIYAIPQDSVKNENEDESEKIEIRREKEEIPFVFDDRNLLNCILEINNGNYRNELLE